MAEEKKADVSKQVKAELRQKEMQEKKLREQKEEAKAATPAEKPAGKPVEKPTEKIKTEKAVEKPKTEEKPKAGEKKVEEKLVAEKIVTVSLRRAWKTPRPRRARAAVKVLKSQLERYLKKAVKLDDGVNKKIWERGITSPPHKLKLKVKVFENTARVFLT